LREKIAVFRGGKIRCTREVNASSLSMFKERRREKIRVCRGTVLKKSGRGAWIAGGGKKKSRE